MYLFLDLFDLLLKLITDKLLPSGSVIENFLLAG